MTELKKVIAQLNKNKMTILASRPASGKMGFTLELIEEIGIKQNKKILWFDMAETEEWLTINLVTHLSKVNYEDVYYYFHPCLGLRRESRNINQEKFIDVLKLLQSKDIIINNYYAYETKDVLAYLEDYVKLIQPHFIIINSLEHLKQKSTYVLEDILAKIKFLTTDYNVKILFWANLKFPKVYNLANIENFAIIKKVINHVILLKRVSHNSLLILGTYYDNNKVKFNFKGKYNKNLCCLEEINASKSIKK